MPTAQERAKILANEIKKAVRAMKAAEARARQLSEELMRTLAEARAEAEAARTIVEYPSGRYECRKCRQSTLFTEPTTELPECMNCGSREWSGHQPTIRRIQPPPPKRYPAGMYECGKCGVRTAMGEDSDELPVCELCGANALTPVR
ncbi:MAG TPA: hypothetical protein VIL43_08775 [Burkholderiales bacterium]